MRFRCFDFFQWILISVLVVACERRVAEHILPRRASSLVLNDSNASAVTPKTDTPKTDTPKTDVPKTSQELQSEALAVLDRSCVGCHSATNIQGNFGALDNVEAMLASGRYLVAGSPERSLIYTKLAPGGNMPPSGALKPEEVDLIQDWIASLKEVETVPLEIHDVIDIIEKDFNQNVPLADRSQVRYFSFHVANNVGSSQTTLDNMRKAFFKVLNSVSRSPALIMPVAVAPKSLIYRLKLNEIAVPVKVFEDLMLDFYPFTLQFVENGENALFLQTAKRDAALRTAIGSPNYLIRADWWIATATLPIPYERLLQLGLTQAELDLPLGIDILANLRGNQVMRSGFKNSGVSSQNRMVERHSQSNGLAYWLSYDFSLLEASQNIFSNPLGPKPLNSEKSFLHAGGEVIFQLPNGLFGYRLVDTSGAILDKGPTNIVKQNDAPPQFVSAIVNGVSCMNCHGSGLVYKKDEIRAFSTANASVFSAPELEQIGKLYPEDHFFKGAMDKDNSFYFKALSQLGIDPKLPDQVNQAYRFFNRSLNKSDVKWELGISEESMNGLLVKDPFRTQWTSLNSGGVISREELSLLQTQALEQTRLDVKVTEPRLGDYLVTPGCMSESQTRMNNCLVKRVKKDEVTP